MAEYSKKSSEDGDKKARSSEDEDILDEAKKCFDRCVDAEEHNRGPAEEDIRFARLGEQWPSEIKAINQRANHPINALLDSAKTPPCPGDVLVRIEIYAAHLAAHWLYSKLSRSISNNDPGTLR